MALAELDDINRFLPTDKLRLVEGEDDKYQIEAERIIKAQLANTYSATELGRWTTPTNTPAYIRSVAGRITAALYYRERYAEDIPDVPEYAQLLYDEALHPSTGMIVKIINGTVTLPEVATADRPTDLKFLPDSSSFGPAFAMDMDL